jgi:hypothetical protein
MASKTPNNQTPHLPIPTYECRVAMLSCEEKAELKERIKHTIEQEEKD